MEKWKQPTLSKVGWKIARFLYRLGDRWDRLSPTHVGSDIISWMEVRGICCDRHQKKENQ